MKASDIRKMKLELKLWKMKDFFRGSVKQFGLLLMSLDNAEQRKILSALVILGFIKEAGKDSHIWDGHVINKQSVKEIQQMMKAPKIEVFANEVLFHRRTKEDVMKEINQLLKGKRK